MNESQAITFTRQRARSLDWWRKWIADPELAYVLWQVTDNNNRTALMGLKAIAEKEIRDAAYNLEGITQEPTRESDA